ncbi:MAG: type IV pilus assembly protein FimV, partial [Steroidobacteraceae bacterium]
MVAKPVRWALAGLLACPSLALALGLGDVHLHSTLDAPLRATIELVGATPDELQSLKPQIAARGLFVQNGLNWSPFLADVKVTVTHGPNGHDVLELRSTKSVTQPFLTMLIELDWDRGRVVREYDLLFDPPVYTPQQTAAAPSIAAPVSGSSAREGAVERAPARASTAPA